jgi:hypothetical protein
MLQKNTFALKNKPMKKLQIFSSIIFWCIIFYSFIQPQKEQGDEIPFPSDYRNWTHIKTAINNPAFGSHAGFHHIYANKKAVDGYKTGRFTDGSIIVFDVLESIQQKNADVIEGKRKLIDMMLKDSLKYKETGGWGYQEFIYSDSNAIKVLIPTRQQCFSCHTSQKENDYIFSKFRN